MTTETLIEQVDRRRAQAAADRLADYRRLVVALCDDAAADAAAADDVLRAAGKTPADLKRDIAELEQRRADAVVAARLPELRERERLSSLGFVDIRERLRAFNETIQQEILERTRKDAALNAEISIAEAAARRLRAGAPDPREPALRAEQSRLDQQRRHLLIGLGNDTSGARGKLRDVEQAIQSGSQQAVAVALGLSCDDQIPPGAVARLKSDLSNAERQLVEIESRLAVVNADLAEVERRQLSAE